jgi:hypothetical protein
VGEGVVLLAGVRGEEERKVLMWGETPWRGRGMVEEEKMKEAAFVVMVMSHGGGIGTRVRLLFFFNYKGNSKFPI